MQYPPAKPLWGGQALRRRQGFLYSGFGFMGHQSMGVKNGGKS